MLETLRMVNMDQEVYEIGLRRSVSQAAQPEVAAKLIQARHTFRRLLAAADKNALIESFESDSYNAHASVAKNILFGTRVGPRFVIDNLGHDAYMRQVIEQCGLTNTFLNMGRKLAMLKAELFHDLPPRHEFFDRFSFINAATLPLFEAILRRLEVDGLDSLDESDRERLTALPFKLVEAQDHEDLIDAALKLRLLEARRAFASGLPERLRAEVRFFDAESYNAASSIVDNILFGTAAVSKAGTSAETGRILAAVVDELGLRDNIIVEGLAYDVGPSCARLTNVQRQKIALARCLLKRPDILIMNESMSALDLPEQERILTSIKAEMTGCSLILFESHEDRQRNFEKILVMDQGRFVDHRGGTAAAGVSADAGNPHATPAIEPSSGSGLNEIASMLMDIPLFTGIDRSKLKLLAFTSERIHFEPGQCVFRQGDPGDHAYVIIQGEAEVVLESEVSSSTVAMLGRNELFGEMALLGSMPRTATIRAHTPLLVLSLSQDVFLGMVEESSEIAVGMMRVLAERLAATLKDYGRVMSEGREIARSTTDLKDKNPGVQALEEVSDSA
jgi:putative ABC transport system ATP-binding protein